MNRPKKITVTLEVTNDAEAHELNEAWEEIVTGKKLARTEALEHGSRSDHGARTSSAPGH